MSYRSVAASLFRAAVHCSWVAITLACGSESPALPAPPSSVPSRAPSADANLEPEATIPDVLGLRFGGSLIDIKRYLPPDAKPDEYPLIPLIGYELIYPNPDNWTVLVQEAASQEMAANAIWLIAISRKVPNQCTRDQTNELAGQMAKKYGPQFHASYTQPIEGLEGVRFVGVSSRRMLAVKVGCFVDDQMFATFAYFDLDRYRYHNIKQIERMLNDELTQATEYGARTFK